MRFTLPSPLLALVLVAPVSAPAATPDNGLLTDSQRNLAYTFPAETRANASNQIEGTDPAYVCSPSDTPYACDTYRLTVTLPAGYMKDHPNDVILIEPTTTTAQSDIDSQLEDENGTVLTVTRDNPPTQPNIRWRPEDGTHVYLIQLVPGSPHEGGTVSVTLLAGDPPPEGAAYAPRFQMLMSPADQGNDAGEPSIGYNPMTRRALFQSGLQTLRVTFAERRADDALNPAGLPEACDALWEDVSSAFTGNVTLDPIGIVDPTTGRGYAGQLGPKQHTMTFTDDDGETWSNSVGNFPGAAGVDHQTIGWAPYVAGGNAGPVPGSDYPNAVYYCSQDIAYANCSRSDDGGQSFLPPIVAYAVADCGGLHGHIRAAPDGSVYLPNKNCNNQQGVAVSEDNGVTWAVRRIPDSSPGDTDPQMALANDGTGYFCYTDSLGTPRVAVTRDKGVTWTNSYDLGAPVGVKRAVFAQGIAGDGDRAACGFLGTDTAGNSDAEDFPGVWHGYIAITYDRGQTWSVSNVTPGDPVQGAGGICTSGTTCGSNRNLLDFNEMTLDEVGRPVLGFADGCIGSCVTNPSTVARSAKGAIARAVGGRSLYKVRDGVTLDRPEPYKPQAPCLAGTRDADGSVLSWRSPADDGKSSITSYKLFRATTLDAIRSSTTPLVSLTPKNKYNDTTADPDEPEYFYKMVAINAVGESVASNVIKVVLDVTAPVESRCIVPGLTILTDAEGDSTGGMQSQDLRSVAVAQPLSAAGTPKLFFTIKVTSLDTLTSGSAYFVSFKAPDNVVRGVRMQVTNPAAPTFHTYVAGSNATGTITDGRFADSQEPADPASTYDPATGVITIIALPGPLGLTTPGQKLTGFNAGVTQTTDIGGVGSGATNVQDEMPDGLGRIGEFEFKSNEFCEINTPPLAALAVDVQTGSAPLTVQFNSGGSSDADSQDSIAEYVFDFGDGTETVTQAAATVTHVYTETGFYNARVRVKDSRGLSSSTMAAKVIEVTEAKAGGETRLGGSLAPWTLAVLGLLALGNRRRWRRDGKMTTNSLGETMGIAKTRVAARIAGGLQGRIALILLGTVLAGAASAAETIRPPDRYIAYGGWYMVPGDRDIDYGIGFDIAYAGRLDTRRWWEAKLFTAILETGDETKPDAYQSGIGLDLIQSLGDESRSHFFALLGGGAALNDVSPDTEDGTTAYGNVGFGLRGDVWQNWGMRPRVEARYVYDTFGEGVSDFLINFVMEIPPKREKVVEKVVEVEKIVEVPVEVEKIVEKEVVCVVPAAEPVAPVAASDTDRDGVPDEQDRCPETLAGAKVDEKGCVKEEQKISLPNIEFESGSTVLAPGGKEKLESVVAFLQNQTEVQVDVFGHTDSQGKDAYNLKLSQGRAQSVMEYLVSRGVSDKRLSAKGFGETQPIGTNETAEGRALNRRVELLLRTKK